MELTATQISNYLLTNSFSTERTTASNLKSPVSTKKVPVATKDIGETLKLLKGSSSALGKVLTNLKEMQELASSINKRSGTEAREEVYAKLRSLSSGIDDIVEKTTFNKETLLDGAELDLKSAGQYSHMLLENLTSSSDDMALAKSETGTDAKVYYDDFCIWNNAMVRLSGLNISSAKGSEVDPAVGELESGEYSIEVDYAGPKSSVIVKKTDGTEISRQDDVDLSGSGVTTVNFGCGVALTFDKTVIQGASVDKYDYEKSGPAVLYANLSYKRVNTFQLAGAKEETDRGVSMDVAGRPATDASGNSFSIASVGLGSVGKSRTEAATGTYRAEVYKVGDYASAVLYDGWGRIVGGLSDVELNKNGTTSLDFGNGVVLSVKDENMTGNAVLKATVSYEQAVNAYDGFDFTKYANAISEAISSVKDQQKVLDTAASSVSNVQDAINGKLSGSVFNTTNLLVKDLLGGSSNSAMSLLSGSSSSTGGLSWASNLITNNLTSALGLSRKADTNITSLLSGNVKSLEPVTLPTTNHVRSS
jgi:hypothetical protein